MPKNGDRPRGLYKAPFKVKRPEKASQTLLAHIDKCAYSGALYIKHKGGPQSAPMARGEAFHAFAEQATNYLIEAGEPEMPPEVAKDMMQVILEERVDLGIPSDEQDACRLMAWHWGLATFLDLEAVVGVEIMLELEVGDWVIRGKLDRLEITGRNMSVRDYKTSKHIQSKEEYRVAFQPQMYGLVALEGVPEGETIPLGQGFDGVHTHEDYPRYRREEDGQLVERYEYYDRAHMHDFKRTLETYLTKLEHGLATQEWTAQDGSHCRYCPAVAECPIPPKLKKVKVIGSEDDARTVARRVVKTERELKADKAAIKAWVDDNGRLIVGDEAWDYHHQPRETSDKERIQAFIEDKGGTVGEFYEAGESTPFKKKKIEEEATA